MENYSDGNHMNEFIKINSLYPASFSQAITAIVFQPTQQLKVHELFLPIFGALLL